MKYSVGYYNRNMGRVPMCKFNDWMDFESYKEAYEFAKRFSWMSDEFAFYKGESRTPYKTFKVCEGRLVQVEAD